MSSSTGLEIWEARRQEKLERASRGYDLPHYYPGYWNYDRAEWKEALRAGYRIDIDVARQDYVEWVRTEEYNVLQDSYTREFIFIPIAKRGNRAYANRYRKKMDEEARFIAFQIASKNLSLIHSIAVE